MLRAAARIISLTVALAITGFTADALSLRTLWFPPGPECLCVEAQYVKIEPWPGRAAPPVRLLRPRAPTMRVPQLICEMPGDPTAVVPCDSQRIIAG